MFTLDPRLASDSYPVHLLSLCDVRLKRDSAANPWLLLVPRRPNLVEIHDLAPVDRHALIDEIGQVTAALKAASSCDKINVAAFGNTVPQMHVHVIARFTMDPWWPGPLDMTASGSPWDDAARQSFCARLIDAL